MMDFSWTEEQDALYSTILRASQEKLNDCNHELGEVWTRTQWELCGELGLLGLCAPEQYQGGGLSALSTARAIEAFGRGCEDMGLVFSASAHLFACTMPIVEYGNDVIKNSVLPDLCSGKKIGANAITEENAGSDVFNLKTHATLDGNSYILEGQKSYVSNGPIADLFIVYAMTNPAHGYLGLTAFLVEKDTPGLVIGKPFRKMGLTSTPACTISFEACH